ncbi:GNAT family N-acetyltransferase [Sphingomonas sp.]|uniref:GNAT family N-acetyltransferase n=1 Tax=Sphingomonas sp. TaxID=28214 RepID=UPI00286ABFCE|nr:GNAT family N-acetyltransferase [Sphingomonas sp.]
MADAISTERLLLRRATMADAPAMFRILSDARAMRYWSFPAHQEIAQTEAWLQSMVEADPAISDDFIMTRDGAVLGKFGAWRLPEFGFLLDPAEWGKGYASESLTAFIGRRRALGSTKLTADVDPRNLPSLRLLERHGFTETHRKKRTFQIGEEWVDSIYLALRL